MTRLFLALVGTSLLATPALAKRAISLGAGTMQLGGSATVDITNAAGSTDVTLNLMPSFGYFVAPRVELLGEAGLASGSGITAVNFGAGARYHIDMKPNWFYLGGTVGITNMSSVTGFRIAPEAGIIVPLSKNVGLDLGTKVGITSVAGTTAINVPLGFLGISSYWR